MRRLGGGEAENATRRNAHAQATHILRHDHHIPNQTIQPLSQPTLALRLVGRRVVGAAPGLENGVRGVVEQVGGVEHIMLFVLHDGGRERVEGYEVCDEVGGWVLCANKG